MTLTLTLTVAVRGMAVGDGVVAVVHDIRLRVAHPVINESRVSHSGRQVARRKELRKTCAGANEMWSPEDECGKNVQVPLSGELGVDDCSTSRSPGERERKWVYMWRVGEITKRESIVRHCCIISRPACLDVYMWPTERAIKKHSSCACDGTPTTLFQCLHHPWATRTFLFTISSQYFAYAVHGQKALGVPGCPAHVISHAPTAYGPYSVPHRSFFTTSTSFHQHATLHRDDTPLRTPVSCSSITCSWMTWTLWYDAGASAFFLFFGH